ncbi:MAG: ABC transporter permease [Flavitalea sp.]
MLKSYFIIAIRQFERQKMYSAIKVGGFALGIAACILIALFIRNELSYDSAVPDADRIFRIYGEFRHDGIVDKGTSFPPPMASVIKKDFPEVELSGRLMANPLFNGAGSNYLRRSDQDQNTYEQGFSYADQQSLNILQLPMVYGDRAHALSEPNSLVLSKKKADKYFPGQNPVGKTMFLNNDKTRPYTIGGVMQDFPTTSHLQYDFFLTLSGLEFWPGEQTGWGTSNYDIYVRLQPGVNIPSFEKKLSSAIINNYIVPSMLSAGQKDAEKIAKEANVRLQALQDIHLKSFDIHDSLVHGDIRFVWLFGAVACFILLIACINFINLSTAKSANRAKEVGLRKVVGCYRSGLVKQFLTESILFSVLSFAAGTFLAWALLPYFNDLSAKSLTMPWTAWWLIPLMMAAAVFIGIVAGLYPSFYLSSFNPINVLKGQLSRGAKNSGLRNGLVVFQFTASIILVIAALVVYNQMHFILNKKVGFEKDQVILVEGANTLSDNDVKNFKNELLKLPTVNSVSIGDYLPVAGTKRNGNSFFNEGREKVDNGARSQFWQVDNDYIPTMGIKMIAGRNFSPSLSTDSQSVVINQTLARELNLKDPIGKRVSNYAGVYTVIGVMEDFNFESLRDNIIGLCLHLGNSPSIVSIKANTSDMSDLLKGIESTWKKFTPSQPIRYAFLDERFAGMYADVQRMGRIFTSFAVLAILIACLGLFALSAFMAEQRSKEIAIRKALGASVSGITALLSKDFIRLVIMAILIASPIAWWAMNKWLQDFTYRISISWWIPVLAAIVAIFIALLTVSFQAVKAALANPVDSLKTM